jgi:hypothetical protein
MALACVLALRPRRRRDTGRSRQPRAFGIVGAAGLVRYRAKIEDPKDAGVKVGSKDPNALKPQIEQLLNRHRFRYELRSVSPAELHCEVHVPLARKTDRLSKIILNLHSDNVTAVEWDEKKEKK